MDEYKKLLVLLCAIENIERLHIPMNIINENIKPLKEYIENRIIKLEESKKWMKQKQT